MARCSRPVVGNPARLGAQGKQGRRAHRGAVRRTAAHCRKGGGGVVDDGGLYLPRTPQFGRTFTSGVLPHDDTNTRTRATHRARHKGNSVAVPPLVRLAGNVLRRGVLDEADTGRGARQRQHGDPRWRGDGEPRDAVGRGEQNGRTRTRRRPDPALGGRRATEGGKRVVGRESRYRRRRGVGEIDQTDGTGRRVINTSTERGRAAQCGDAGTVGNRHWCQRARRGWCGPQQVLSIRGATNETGGIATRQCGNGSRGHRGSDGGPLTSERLPLDECGGNALHRGRTRRPAVLLRTTTHQEWGSDTATRDGIQREWWERLMASAAGTQQDRNDQHDHGSLDSCSYPMVD